MREYFLRNGSSIIAHFNNRLTGRSNDRQFNLPARSRPSFFPSKSFHCIFHQIDEYLQYLVLISIQNRYVPFQDDLCLHSRFSHLRGTKMNHLPK